MQNAKLGDGSFDSPFRKGSLKMTEGIDNLCHPEEPEVTKDPHRWCGRVCEGDPSSAHGLVRMTAGIDNLCHFDQVHPVGAIHDRPLAAPHPPAIPVGSQ